MDALNIAVVEDEKAWRGFLSKTIKDIFDDENIAACVDQYDSGESLAKALADGIYYDMYFLDIEMGNMNGIQLGHIIRETYKYEEAIILYVSSHTKYHGELFDVHPYNFIWKQMEMDDLRIKIAKAIERLKHSRDMFECKIDKSSIYVMKSKILYLESNNRKINIVYKANNEYKIASYFGALKMEAEKLLPPDFIFPHASYIVNLRHVIKTSRRELAMSNGKIIGIARSKSGNTHKIILQFMSGGHF